MRARQLRQILLLVFLLVLGACNTIPVAQDIDQRQAHEIVAALNSQGISAVATRGSGSRALFTVEVKRDQYSQAIAIMNDRALPSDRPESFGEMIAQHGIVPNSREVEAIRLDHALAVEIQEALIRNPGVSSASVIVRQNFLKDSAEPKVSVVVQGKPGQSVDSAEVTQLVAHSVPGIQADHIFVSWHELPAASDRGKVEGVKNVDGKPVQVPLVPFLWAWTIPDGEYTSLVLVLLGVIALMAACGLLIGYWYGYQHFSQTVVDERLPDIVPRSTPPDRSLTEL